MYTTCVCVCVCVCVRARARVCLCVCVWVVSHTGRTRANYARALWKLRGRHARVVSAGRLELCLLLSLSQLFRA